jgi:enediyne polyketide synthase
VADAEVSLNSDPYFADHALQGIGILPAVIGLEALAQAVCAMHGAQQHYSFEQVEFSRPITLPSASSRTLRLLALAHTNNTTTVALRSSETHFAIDHLRAVFRTGSAAETDSRGAAPSWRMTQDPAANLTLFDPDAHLYGISLFQAGRFRRLKGYEVLSARTCRAEVPADGTSTWFARDFPPELLLGDPGARDAALHALQACVPHARVLPISVERVETSRLATDQPHWVQAIEQQSLGDGYLFDLEILDRSDRVLESWKGLRLRQIEPVPVHAWSPALLGPYIERRVGELLPQSNICVQVEDGPSVGGNREESQRIHRPDGRPVIDKPGYISFADTGDLRLLISSRSTVGCDVEPAQDRSQEIWRGLLGVEGWRLALILGAAYPLCDACTLVWAARESLRKVGLVGEQPLSAISQSDDGWAVLSSGRFKIPAFVMTMKGAPERIAVAIAVEG